MASGFTVSSRKYSENDGKRPPSGIRVKKERSSSSLEILDSENGFSISENSSRRTGHIPPRPGSNSSLGRSVPSASKQVSLQTVRRKTDVDDKNFPDLDNDDEERERKLNERLEKLSLSGRSSRNLLRQDSKSKLNGTESSQKDKKEKTENESSSEEESDEEEERKAPNELFMEFLSCVMNKDYETAQKLCKMILIYEPNHQEALSFQKLIDEKIILDQIPDDSEDDEERESGNELDSGDGDGDDDDDDDDDDKDDDSDESSSDESSDSSDDDDSSAVHTTDSGITSASVSDHD